MANTNLTIDMITREAARILVNNLGFARNVNREYSDEYANDGAKIGDTLRVRKPARYTVRSGATLDVQNHTETKVDLTLSNQKGVDVNFTTKELTLDIDDFSDRILNPAMAAIANQIDLDGLALYKDVFNSVGTPGTTPATAGVLLSANEYMDDQATPRDGERCLAVNPAANASLVDGLKGLFHASDKVESQYTQGMMGMNTLGYKEIYMDQNVNTHTTGDYDGAHIINDASFTAASDTATTSTLTLDTGTGTYAVGDVFTIADVYSVNPQNRQSTGKLQQFTVVTSTSTTSVAVSPPIRNSGAFQTVDSLPANDAALTEVGTASTIYPQNLAYHRDAFTLGTADLLMPSGVDFASRQVYEGISMRIVRQYDINNDQMPCRIDVLYGYKTIYGELACRVWG